MSAGNVFDVAIFDYDGTLSDTRFAIAHCIESAFVKHGRAILVPDLAFQIVGKGLPLRETCVLLDEDLTGHPATLDDLVSTYRALYRSEGEALIKLFPGVRETLQQVHQRGVRCLVVSNKGIEAVQRSLARDNLTGFIDFIFADQLGMPHKPDLALLTEHVFPKFPQTPRRRMLMVGDTEIDIEFARTAGIACCWAAYGFGDKERCRSLAPEHHIDSIEELPAIIWPGR